MACLAARIQCDIWDTLWTDGFLTLHHRSQSSFESRPNRVPGIIQLVYFRQHVFFANRLSHRIVSRMFETLESITLFFVASGQEKR